MKQPRLLAVNTKSEVLFAVTPQRRRAHGRTELEGARVVKNMRKMPLSAAAIGAAVAVAATLAMSVPAQADMPYFGRSPEHGSYWNGPHHDYRANGSGLNAFAMGRCHTVKVRQHSAHGSVAVHTGRRVCS